MRKKIEKAVLEMEKKSSIILSSSSATHGLKRSIRNLLNEISLFKNHSKSKFSGNPSIKAKDLDVQIGGGHHHLDKFLNIDIVPPADLIWDVREEIPLKSGSARFIFSEHFLEHIDYPTSVKRFIKECYRLLKNNGKLAIGVPDGALAIQAYCNNNKKLINKFKRNWYGKRDCLEHFNTKIDFLNYHLRDQDDDKKYHPHLWAYDYEKLESLLKGAGFQKIKKWKFDGKIANPKRKFGSVYVTAVK